MGFVKWLLQQYKAYKIEKCFPKVSKEEQDRINMNNYCRCLEEGFSPSQINALVNLLAPLSRNKEVGGMNESNNSL